MERIFIVLSGAYGLLAVGLGAFGAHGLQRTLSSLDDGAERLQWWETAAHYHLVHALALGLVAYVAGRQGGALAAWAGGCLAAGVLLFSGSLYTMTLTGMRALGAVTPFGGLLLMSGWLLLAVAGWRL